MSEGCSALQITGAQQNSLAAATHNNLALTIQNILAIVLHNNLVMEEGLQWQQLRYNAGLLML